MAFRERLQGLLSGADPMGNLGLGLLSASGPSPVKQSLGQILGQGVQFASGRQQAAMQNEALREQLLQQGRRREVETQLAGLLGGGEPATPQQLMGLLAQIAPAEVAQGLLAQMKPGSMATKIGDVESHIGRQLTDDEVLKLAGGGTTINIGDKLNEPIPISSIQNVRLPNGQPVPIGTTFSQARELGAQVQSSEEQKRNTQADAALGILSDLERMAVGPDGVFREVRPGLANRVASALTFGIEMLEQNDPRAAQFHDMSKATLAPFIKFLGESGALADGDVNRAMGLLPRIFPLPDTEDVAKDKLQGLRSILERGVSRLNGIQSGEAEPVEAVKPLPEPKPPQERGPQVRRFRFNPATLQLEPQ